MKLICYPTHGDMPTIRPAPVERGWMDASPGKFAYRCLPLNIANAHGWEVLSPLAFKARWNGDPGTDGVRIKASGPEHLWPISHFGQGVLTMHMRFLLRTEPRTQLFVTGPVNRAKPAIAPLSGIIETDWAPYTFTMNWRFSEPFRWAHFEKDEPYCTFFPLSLDLIEDCQPEIRDMAEDPELARQFADWSKDRNSFNADLKVADSKARADKWQKIYTQGVLPGGQKASIRHRTKVKLQPFTRSTDETG